MKRVLKKRSASPMNGFIQIPRNDPLWNLKPDERDVFLWFIKEAAFKDHERKFNGMEIIEKRGQKTVTWPILCYHFGYEIGKMRWLIKTLVKQKFLQQVLQQNGRQVGRQVYAVVNYDTYQPPTTGLATGLATGFTTDHPEEGSILKKVCPEEGSFNKNELHNDNGSKSEKASDIRPISFKEFQNRFLKQYASDDFIESMEYYVDVFEEKMGKPHSRLKPDQWERAWENIQTVFRNDSPIELTHEDIEKMIDKHFETKYEDCDYNILHFTTEGIMANRFFEECY